MPAYINVVIFSEEHDPLISIVSDSLLQHKVGRIHIYVGGDAFYSKGSFILFLYCYVRVKASDSALDKI